MQQDLIDSSDNSHKPHVTGLITKTKKNNKNKPPKKHASYVKVPYLINPMKPEQRWLY